MLIDDIKVELDISDSAKDNILNRFIKKSIIAIKNYINNSTFDSTYIEQNFNEAIIETVKFNYRKKGKELVKSETQGSRSSTYIDEIAFVIPQSAKELLPTPYIKMF